MEKGLRKGVKNVWRVINCCNWHININWHTNQAPTSWRPFGGAMRASWSWAGYKTWFQGLLCKRQVVKGNFQSLPAFKNARSLVVYDLGVSSPTPKAQGLISGQEQRFHKLFVMALSEIKTNTQKWETRDEPQTNVSYKIRQIIKIMEYTHIHIHP